jgi:hypothetical protein
VEPRVYDIFVFVYVWTTKPTVSPERLPIFWPAQNALGSFDVSQAYSAFP